MKARDLTGQVYGMLTVCNRLTNRKGITQSKVRWLVKCDCGNAFEVDAADLYRKDGKRRVSCGCMNFRKAEKSPFWKSSNKISHTYWTAVIGSALKRNIDFNITIQQAYRKFLQQKGICSLSGLEIELNKTASLDRIDSSKGYTESNIQWLHKDINKLKSNWSEDKFINLCKKVAQYDKTR